MAKITVTDPTDKRASAATHCRTLKKSTTLSRKYVKRPAAPARIDGVRRVTPVPTKKPDARALAIEARDKAVKSALRSVATMEKQEAKEPVQPNAKIKSKKKGRHLALALLCSTATIGLLAVFIYKNIPDISVKVAAMQTGIEAAYPAFIPRGYSLSSVTTEKEGGIVMYFTNADGNKFTLTEKNSTWDSTALLNNFVKKDTEYNPATLREQGITIYVYGKKAAWVDGGIFYKVEAEDDALTKEQIRNLATSV